MKKIVMLLILFAVCCNGYAQGKNTDVLQHKSTKKKIKKEVPPPPFFKYEKPHKIDVTQYNLTKRLSFYPFNKATKIMVVSFSTTVASTTDIEVIRDTIASDSVHLSLEKKETIAPFTLPRRNGTILWDQMDQIKTLTLSEAITLSDVLYNSCSRWSEWEDKKTGCYFPRNAILFFDDKDQPFEYLEICFECRAIEKSSPKIKVLENCSYLYEELQKYFTILGIKTQAKNE